MQAASEVGCQQVLLSDRPIAVTEFRLGSNMLQSSGEAGGRGEGQWQPLKQGREWQASAYIEFPTLPTLHTIHTIHTI